MSIICHFIRILQKLWSNELKKLKEEKNELDKGYRNALLEPHSLNFRGGLHKSFLWQFYALQLFQLTISAQMMVYKVLKCGFETD